MKTIKILCIILLSFVAAASVRVTLKRYTPGLYSSVWGQLPAPVSPAAKRPESPLPTSRPESKPSRSSSPGHELSVTGILRRGERVIVVMSDGSVRTDEDNVPGKPNRLTRVTRTFMDWDGERYWVKPKTSTGGTNTENTPEKSLTPTMTPP